MDTKNNNMPVAILLIVGAATLSSFGQLAWKIGADATSLKLAYFLYFLGFLSAGLGMVVMMLAFRFGEVSILQPMMSLGFALSIFLGAIFLNEPITTNKIIGTLFIVVGSGILGIEGSKDND